MRPKIIVVGSFNIDLIASVERLPAAGETVAAKSLNRRLGGKGANQAVAAARQGAAVSLIGCLGDDADGRAYRRRLRAEGLVTTGVSTAKHEMTGTALIAVDRQGENIIVVASGANGALTPALVRAQEQRIVSADFLLLQFEVSLASVVGAVRIANGAGVPVALNPSPLRNGFPWGKHRLDTVIVNAGEARAIFGLRLSDSPQWQRR